MVNSMLLLKLAIFLHLLAAVLSAYADNMLLVLFNSTLALAWVVFLRCKPW